MRAGIFPGDSTDYKDLPFLAEAGVLVPGELGFDPGDIDGYAGVSRLNAQLAVYSISAAAWDRLNGPLSFTAVAGHSLGLYAALYAAGVFDLSTGKEIVMKAYQAIHTVAADRPGGMTAIVGINWKTLEDVCRDIPDAYVANINSATQVVISGSPGALEDVERRAQKEGALGIKRLDVDAPLHSPLMEGVEEIMRSAVRDMELKEAALPVVNTIAPAFMTGRKEIEDVLCGQFARRVLWRDTVNFMHEKGIDEFVEIGPSDLLTRIIRWIQRDVEALSTAGAIERYGIPGNGRTGNAGERVNVQA